MPEYPRYCALVDSCIFEHLADRMPETVEAKSLTLEPEAFEVLPE
jgi:hypothetical protein